MNTLDMHVVAVDAKSGLELWKTKMFDYTAAGGYAATGAPLVVKDKVIVGMAGGERAVSGFLDAYDAKTGAHAWRFHTIPQPGEPNFGTWAGDSWKTGGGCNLEYRFVRSGHEHAVLGHGKPVAGLLRR